MIEWLNNWNHTNEENQSLLFYGVMISIAVFALGFGMFMPYISYYFKINKKYFIALTGFWFLMPTSVYVLGSMLGRIVKQDMSNVSSFALSALIIDTVIIICMFVFHFNLKKVDTLYDKYNEIKLCSDCGVYSREGHIKLYQSTGQTGCPVCGRGKIKKQDKYNINHNLPLSPELGFIQCIRLFKLLNNKKTDDFTNDQAEKYIKAQEEKIRRMKESQEN